ncbi:hypothetical protein O3M35_004503 [Rhynocoris fuscipes]|uniref:Uncharacterized protein n=1 Tax=Rhynocoris fuscipes TaxID=488301 RepID=A0AAW1CKZ3_9HEMI
MPAPAVSAGQNVSQLVGTPNFNLPVPFSFAHPPAFLPPSSAAIHTGTYAQPPTVSSASSHSSESSTSSHQTWSFEEQFKQVRQASNVPNYFFYILLFLKFSFFTFIL